MLYTVYMITNGCVIKRFPKNTFNVIIYFVNCCAIVE